MADPDEKSLGLSLWKRRLKKPKVPDVAAPKDETLDRLRLRKPKQTVPKSKLDVRGLLKSRPGDGDRGLTSPDPHALGLSLGGEKLRPPQVEGVQGLPTTIMAQTPDARSVVKPRATDAERGLQSGPGPRLRRPALWTKPLRSEPKPDYVDKDTASRLVKRLILEACQAVGRQDLATVALAIAMQEDKTLSGNYPFGDIFQEDPKRPGRLEEVRLYPDLDETARPGFPKRGDAANFGIYKMNWHMIKQCDSAKKLVPNVDAPNAWIAAGSRINADRRLATQILIEALVQWSPSAPDAAHPVTDNFWAGQRWGESGLKNLPPSTVPRMWDDIVNYYHAIQVIKANIEDDENIWKSQTRYGMNVPAV